MRNSALQKLTSWTLVLICIFLSAGGANALVSCNEPDGYSHVEYNLAGRCDFNCDSSTSFPHSKIPSLSLEDKEISICQDVSLSQDLARSNFQQNVYNLPIIFMSAIGAPYFPPAHQIPVRLLHAPQPPPQALAALRTTVLII
jgi:hypothetical protein